MLEGFREEGTCRLNLWGEVSWSRWALGEAKGWQAFGAVGEAEHRAGGAWSGARSAPSWGKPQGSHRGLLRKEETGESASPSSALERETGFQDPPPLLCSPEQAAVAQGVVVGAKLAWPCQVRDGGETSFSGRYASF